MGAVKFSSARTNRAASPRSSQKAGGLFFAACHIHQWPKSKQECLKWNWTFARTRRRNHQRG